MKITKFPYVYTFSENSGQRLRFHFYWDTDKRLYTFENSRHKIGDISREEVVTIVRAAEIPPSESNEYTKNTMSQNPVSKVIQKDSINSKYQGRKSSSLKTMLQLSLHGSIFNKVRNATLLRLTIIRIRSLHFWHIKTLL